MRIVKAIENMTASNQKLMYMCNTRPVLKTGALFSDVTEEYRIPAEPQPGDTVKLRLRTGRYNVDTAYLYVNNQEYEMYRVANNTLFDYYEASVEVAEEKLYYYFKVVSGKNVCFYNQIGAAKELNPFYNFQIMPGFQTPEWAKGAVMYQIFVDRFCDGGAPLLSKKPGLVTHKNWNDLPNEYSNKPLGPNLGHDFFGGNLNGIIEKLPYLKNLGVTVLYLNPIFDAQSNHKYDTGDYTHVDPTFGTNEDFARLCKAARSQGIRVMLDGVFSHTGDNSVYFNRYGLYNSVGAYQSKDSPYASWYRFKNFPEEYDCWWGVKTLPEVEENCPSYRDFIIEDKNSVVAQWIRRGSSGWRLDVADELPDDFIIALRKRVKAENPDAAVLGEVWEDVSNKVAYGQLRSYALGHSLDSAMNYPLRNALLNFFTGKGTSEDFARTVRSLHENYPPQMFYALMNLVGSHDRARVLNVLAGLSGENAPKETWRTLRLDQAHYDMAKRRLKAMFALVCALPGMPTVYYGDEAGMQGAGDPYNRATFPWGQEDGELTDCYRRLIARRRSDPIWRRGELSVLAPHPDVILVVRRIENGRDALGKKARNGAAFFAISRSQESITLLLDSANPALAPFMPLVSEITLSPLLPFYFHVM